MGRMFLEELTEGIERCDIFQHKEYGGAIFDGGVVLGALIFYWELLCLSFNFDFVGDDIIE